ncbi:MAG: esterase [Lachnospiraceae bacterium]|nr:esterase [Lachnospiraceae bacterium]
MEYNLYGDPEATVLLAQLFDRRESGAVEKEIDEIRKLTDTEFTMIAVTVDAWNDDLSPWNAPAVYGKKDFGGGASRTLDAILKYMASRDLPGGGNVKCCIGGYSLAGLFALWAAYQTDVFSGVGAASPSVWYPGFTDYMREHDIRAGRVYLSLGDAEPRTRHPVMSTVGDRIEEAHDLLSGAGADCTLEWNSGNHFADPELRTAKAFAWLLNDIH